MVAVIPTKECRICCRSDSEKKKAVFTYSAATAMGITPDSIVFLNGSFVLIANDVNGWTRFVVDEKEITPTMFEKFLTY